MLDDKKELWSLAVDGPCPDTTDWMFEGSPYALKEKMYFPYQWLDIEEIIESDDMLEDWLDEVNCPKIFMNQGNIIEDYKNRAPMMK